jgi:ubiquinone/menaquinone biosynthesis C-methylase UbiE
MVESANKEPEYFMPSFVSYIPTEAELIPGFFELAPLSAGDVVYDLGCGDGRLLFAAVEHGAGKAVGIDLDGKLIAGAQFEARKKGLGDRINFIQGDVLDLNLSGATVIFCYLIGHAAWALKPKFASELKPGARVVMEMFPVPGWKPRQTHVAQFGYESGYREFFLYVMPPVIDATL